MDLKSIGKSIFGGVHLAGKTILSAYGLGSVAQSAEQFESPLLPDWAKSGKKAAGPAPGDVATRPDYAVVVYADGTKKADLVSAPDLVAVSGGKRFDGNGYQSGEPLGSRFSFGWDSPKKVDILVKGKPVSYSGVKQVLILGGQETSTRVAGIERSRVMGVLDDDLSILGADILGDLTSDEVAINETGYSTMHLPDDPTEVLSDTYVHGCDVLGAAPVRPLVAPRGGFVVRQSPATGRTFTSLKLTRPKKGDHATSIKNAQTVAKRQQELATKIEKLKPPTNKQAVHGLTPARQQRRTLSVAQVKQLAAPLKTTAAKIGTNATKHGTNVASTVKKRTTGVQRVQKITKPTTNDKPNVLGGDDWTEVLGLVPGATHAQALADAQARLAAAKAARAAFDAARLATLSAPVATGVADSFAVNVDNPSGVDTSLSPQDLPRFDYEHGVDWGDAPVMAGEEYELLGAAAPDPSNPGYLTDGTLDPGYWGATPTDPSAPDAGATGGPPDYGVGPAPTTAPPLVEGVDYVRDPGAARDINFYSSTKEPGTVAVPVGAVIYDGSQAFPDKGIGSFTYFYKNLPGGAKPHGDNGSGYFWNKDHWTNWWASSYHDGIAIDRRKHPLNPEEAASLPTMAKNSKKHNWGPLIGNPNLEWTKGLRYDTGGNQWFWFYDQAPSWAKAAGDADRLNQAVLDYQTDLGAAQMDYTSQQIVDGLAKDQADELAKSTARDDVQLQHQIDQDTKVSQADAAKQQLLDEASQRQAAAQQQLDLQQWQVESQADQQRSEQEMQFQLQREKAMMEMMQAHPEMAATLMPALTQDGGGGGGEGGEGGYADDAYVADDGQAVDWGEGNRRNELDER